MKVKATGRATSVFLAVCVGTSISAVLTVISAAVIASLILSGHLSEMSVGYSGFIVVPLSVALGSLIAFCMAKRRRLFTSVLVAGVYYALWFGVVSLCFGGVRHGAALVAVMAFAGASIVGVVGLRGRGGGRFDGRKYRPR
jgi:hypothetical protein